MKQMIKKENELYNIAVQDYRGIKFRLYPHRKSSFKGYRAKRYHLVSEQGTKVKSFFWIPNCYLEKDGTLKPNIYIDWVFVKFVKNAKVKDTEFNMPDWLKRKL